MPTTTRRMSSLAPSARRQRADQQIERALLVARVERRERLLRSGRRPRSLELDPRGQSPSAAKLPGTSRSSSSAASSSPRAWRIRASGTAASARDGSSSTRAAQRLLVACVDQLVGLGGQQRVQERVDRGRRLGADELGGDRAVAERLDRRDALDPERARELGLASTSTLPARPCRRGRRPPARGPGRAAGRDRTTRPRSRRPPGPCASAR